MAQPPIVGNWTAGGNEFAVVQSDGELLVIMPSTPAGYEPRVTASDGGWLITGGPFSGVVMELHNDDSGTVGGVFDLARIVDAPAAVPGDGQRIAQLTEDAVRDGEFTQLWDAARTSGGEISWTTGYKKHEFIQWLMQRDEVIFHGSGVTDIAEFLPIRKSLELNDVGGRGNRGAVYGTHDGLWATFFAVVDRSQLVGSIRNGIADYQGPSGDTVRTYQFSIHEGLLAERPFHQGALYLLPRDRFERIPFFEDGPLSNEWACYEPVAPLAKLMMEPSAFPFLETIGGHDDSELLGFSDLGDAVWAGVVSASQDGDTITIVTTTARQVVEEFVEKSLDYYPQVQRIVSEVPEGLAIAMSGPPAFEHGIRERIKPWVREDPS